VVGGERGHLRRGVVKIAELRLILDQLQQLYVSAGANGPAKDFKTFNDVLGPHAASPVDVFVKDLKDRLGRATEKSKGRRKAESGKSASENEEAIRHHVANLRHAGTDRSAFDQAFDLLKSDKSLKLPDLAEIARQYSESVTKYKSIRAAHDDVAKAFVRQARFENKLR
jgi:hypothetical protein